MGIVTSLAKLGGGIILGPATGGLSLYVAGASIIADQFVNVGPRSCAKSFIDNVVRDKVATLSVGSVVYCDLPIGEHSGVYIGNDEIVHLNGSGIIEKVSPADFLQRVDGWNTAISIYASCIGQDSVGSEKVADCAKSRIGKQRDYNFILDNCHQFTSGCLTGDYDNSDNFLWMMKHTAKNVLGANTWRVW